MDSVAAAKDRYHNLATSARGWMIGFFILSLLLAGSMLQLFRLVKEVRVHAAILIPITPDGAYLRPVSIPPTYVSSDVSPQERRMEAINWVRDLRGYVNGDVDAEQNYLDAVVSRIPSDTNLRKEVHDFFVARIKSKTPVIWRLVGVVERSVGTYDIRWSETTQDSAGVEHTTQWEGELESVIKPPHDEATINENPLGFYVVRFVPGQIG